MQKTLLTQLGLLWLITLFAQNPDTERMSSSLGATGTSNRISTISDLRVRSEGFNKVVLSWSSLDSSNDYFVIERSCQLRPFETVAVLHVTKGERSWEWRDESPRQGGVVYRLKVILRDGSQWMAGMTSAIHSNGSTEVKIYPNPAQEALFIRTEFPSDITLLDASGKPRLSLPGITGLHIVNLQGLEKGIYVVRVYNRILNTLSTERIIKN